MLNSSDRCALRGHVPQTAQPPGFFRRIKWVFNGPPDVPEGALCTQCSNDLEARIDHAVFLKEQANAPTANACLTRKQALWLGCSMLFGSALGALAVVSRGQFSTAVSNTGDSFSPSLPPPPLQAWRERPNGGAALRREKFERSRVGAPRAEARVLATTLTPMTESPPASDVMMKKLRMPCVDERAHLSVADVLRQIGRTLQRPFSSMAVEAQVVYFMDALGRCPTESEKGALSRIFGSVDIVVGQLIALLPGSQATMLLQGFAGPLLQMVADDIDGLGLDPDKLSEVNENLTFLARSVVAATPRDQGGHIVGKLELPANTRFGSSGATTDINGETWRLNFRDGRFVATSNGRTVAAEYQREREGWVLHGEGVDFEELDVLPLPNRRETIDSDIARTLSVNPRYPPPKIEIGSDVWYNAMLGPTGERAICAKVFGYWVPVRLSHDGVTYEAYDVNNPLNIGYPVRTESDDNWVFGRPVDFAARRRGQPHQGGGTLSDRLRQAIPTAWAVRHIDTAHLSSPTSSGIMRSGDNQQYISFGAHLLPIQPHELLPDTFEIGPAGSTKVLCAFDPGLDQMVLVPEEYAPDRRSLEAGLTDAATLAMLNQERIATLFAVQRVKGSYRNGFRTRQRKWFPNILHVDTILQHMSRDVYCYGLNEAELASTGKYRIAAERLKETVLEAALHLQQLNIALRNPERSQPLFDRMFDIIGGEPTPEQRATIEQTFLDQLQKSDELMAEHVADDCSRIWLTKLVEDDLYGFTSPGDPLKRIFVNLQLSNAYHDTRVGCSAVCRRRVPRGDDITTILHEASHLAAHTKDVFYLPPPGQNQPLIEKIREFSDGRITEEEGRYLLKLTKTTEADDISPTDLTNKASEIFRTRPDIRAKLILRNADSFAHIVTALSETDMARQVRDASTTASDVLAIISAVVSHAYQLDADAEAASSGNDSILEGSGN